MNSRKHSFKFKWFRWKLGHRREIELCAACLTVITVLLLILPFMIRSAGRFSYGYTGFDSVRDTSAQVR
jgi:hypothetical protein